MSGLAGDPHAIELHLPDGGHVIMAIEDAETRLSGDCDLLIGMLLTTDGGEHEVKRALLETASDLGLSCTASSRHPTILSIRRS